MYNELFTDTCGMFNIWHFMTIILFFLCLWLLLRLSRHVHDRYVRRFHVILAIGITLLEALKISSRILKGYGPDSWVPLYFCSLFLFAVWFALCRWEPLQRGGFAFICMGGVIASVAFTLYPSTSLGMYPLLHPATFHSFIYHLVMCYFGLFLLRRGVYIPRKRDSLYFFLFVLLACVVALWFNDAWGTNCMFLAHPFGLPILQPLLEYSRVLYILTVILGQGVVCFWLHYGLYRILERKAIKL